MKGDFSRITFDPRKHFTRVLMQQGRVTLDADGNEQADIFLYYLRSLAVDIIGPYGGPGDSFLIAPSGNSLIIHAGHYYVHGLLCENASRLDADGAEVQLDYFEQPDYYRDPEDNPLPDPPYLAYLDVWERLVTALQDESIREVALDGPDTGARSRLVWQVKVTNQLPNGEVLPPNLTRANVYNRWDTWVTAWQPANRGMLKARARLAAPEPDPCITDPEARYRGPENQLYRVEIQRGGAAWDGNADNRSGAATFKFSRENGSLVFPIREISGLVVTLEHLGRDAQLGLKVDDWVELVDDQLELLNQPGPLLQVDKIELTEMAVTLRWPADTTPGDLPDYDQAELEAKHPLLRRWDHQAGTASRGGLQLDAGAALIREGAGEQAWLVLEDGLQVQFQPGATYRSGDYWLIPARTATGDVEWPGPEGQPEALPPHGIQHHYAPLGLVTTVAGGAGNLLDLRRTYTPLAQ